MGNSSISVVTNIYIYTGGMCIGFIVETMINLLKAMTEESLDDVL